MKIHKILVLFSPIHTFVNILALIRKRSVFLSSRARIFKKSVNRRYRRNWNNTAFCVRYKLFRVRHAFDEKFYRILENFSNYDVYLNSKAVLFSDQKHCFCPNITGNEQYHYFFDQYKVLF